MAAISIPNRARGSAISGPFTDEGDDSPFDAAPRLRPGQGLLSAYTRELIDSLQINDRDRSIFVNILCGMRPARVARLFRLTPPRIHQIYHDVLLKLALSNGRPLVGDGAAQPQDDDE